VVVEAGNRLFHIRTTNLSLLGAKVRLSERLEEGTRAKLVFQPPDGPAIGVEAIVWRVDEDGPAFFFLEPAPAELLRPAHSRLLGN
jgi:hypothetical protein